MKQISVFSLAACVILIITYTHGLENEPSEQETLDPLDAIADTSRQQSDENIQKNDATPGQLELQGSSAIGVARKNCPRGCALSIPTGKCLPKMGAVVKKC
uniref:Uncharacterized protein n=1 Tax=Anopheles albimanus TaxID=7167 RepID=A0A182FYX3_ANOAL